jgi:hypothetical protein
MQNEYRQAAVVIEIKKVAASTKFTAANREAD